MKTNLQTHAPLGRRRSPLQEFCCGRVWAKLLRDLSICRRDYPRGRGGFSFLHQALMVHITSSRRRGICTVVAWTMRYAGMYAEDWKRWVGITRKASLRSGLEIALNDVQIILSTGRRDKEQNSVHFHSRPSRSVASDCFLPPPLFL